MSAAGNWWPVGHHLLPEGSTLTLEDQMQLQANLDIAERAADRADDTFARARAANLDAEELDRLIDFRWDPPVSVGVRIVSVINDAMQHAGQANYLRGLLERGAGPR